MLHVRSCLWWRTRDNSSTGIEKLTQIQPWQPTTRCCHLAQSSFMNNDKEIGCNLRPNNLSDGQHYVPPPPAEKQSFNDPRVNSSLHVSVFDVMYITVLCRHLTTDNYCFGSILCENQLIISLKVKLKYYLIYNEDAIKSIKVRCWPYIHHAILLQRKHIALH